MFVVQRTNRLCPALIRFARMSTGDLGDGAGKGGGGGGSIRSAGGAFGRMEVAKEEQYFYNKQKEQLHKLQNDQIQQHEYHAQQIKEHEEAIRRHKEYLNKLDK